MNQVEKALQNERTPEEIAAYDNNSGTQTIDDDEFNCIYTGREGTGIKPISGKDRQRLEQINDEGIIQTFHGGKSVILIPTDNSIDGTGYKMIPQKELKNRYLNEPKVSGVNLGTALLAWPGKKFYPGGVTFDPKPGRCPKDTLNLYKGYQLQPQSGNCDPWKQHTEEVICNGNADHAKKLTQYIASGLQKPWIKPTYAPLMISIPGVGKGAWVYPLRLILGSLMLATNGSEIITGKFNSAMRGRTFIYCDEVDLTNRREVNRMKSIITEPTTTVEPKFGEVEQIPNYARFLFSANPVDGSHALYADEHERRYFVLEPSENYVGEPGRKYFSDYQQWLRNGGATYLMDYLLNYPIDDFDPYHPPITDALNEQKQMSMSDMNQFMYEVISSNFEYPEIKYHNSRLSGVVLARHYVNWMRGKMRFISQRSAETQIGYLMKRMGIQKERPLDNGPREYILPPCTELRQLFARAVFDTDADRVFTEQ